LKNLIDVIDEIEVNEDYSLKIIEQKELRDNINNLMQYVNAGDLKNVDKIDKLIAKLNSSKKVAHLNDKQIKDGFQSLRPKGESKKRLITRACSPSRLLRANFNFIDDSDDTILNYIDKSGKLYTIKKTGLTKSLRTITGIDQYNIDDLYDYIIGNPQAPPENTHIIIANRLRIDSDHTNLLSVYSSEKIKPTNAFFMYIVPEEEAKILCLFVNSIFYLSQFVRFSKQSTRGFKEIKQVDMTEVISFPKYQKLTNEDKTSILNYFELHQYDHINPIKIQLVQKEKKELDKLWAKVLGISITEKELMGLYDNVLKELE